MLIGGDSFNIFVRLQHVWHKVLMHLTESKRVNLVEEIGDIMIYLVNVSDKFGIDLGCPQY